MVCWAGQEGQWETGTLPASAWGHQSLHAGVTHNRPTTEPPPCPPFLSYQFVLPHLLKGQRSHYFYSSKFTIGISHPTSNKNVTLTFQGFLFPPRTRPSNPGSPTPPKRRVLMTAKEPRSLTVPARCPCRLPSDGCPSAAGPEACATVAGQTGSPGGEGKSGLGYGVRTHTHTQRCTHIRTKFRRVAEAHPRAGPRTRSSKRY